MRAQRVNPLPLHLIPGIARDHLEHVHRVGGLPTHPLGEGMVVDEQRGIVAAVAETLRLGRAVGVEKAERGTGEPVRARCSQHLNRCNWITTKQEMTTLTLKLNRTLDGQLRRALPPYDVLGRWIGRKIPQLRTLNLRSELRFQHPAHGCLANTARPSDEQEHGSQYAARAGRMPHARPRRFTFFLTVKQEARYNQDRD